MKQHKVRDSQKHRREYKAKHRGKHEPTMRFEYTEDLVASKETHLRDAMRVTKRDTNLRGGQALASQFDDLVDRIFWRSL